MYIIEIEHKFKNRPASEFKYFSEMVVGIGPVISSNIEHAKLFNTELESMEYLKKNFIIVGNKKVVKYQNS